MRENIKISMNSHKVVIFNAPPNAGKDVATQYLVESLGVNHVEFKKPLFDIAKSIAQISNEDWDYIYSDRNLKETPTHKLFNKSPRDHMIFVSENVIKPLYGKDYFGKMFLSNLKLGMNVASDGGFIEELKPTIDNCGKDNVLILRVHRQGCNFNNDSRDYIYNSGCKELDIYNNSTLENFFKEVYTIVKDFKYSMD